MSNTASTFPNIMPPSSKKRANINKTIPQISSPSSSLSPNPSNSPFPSELTTSPTNSILSPSERSNTISPSFNPLNTISPVMSPNTQSPVSKMAPSPNNLYPGYNQQSKVYPTFPQKENQLQYENTSIRKLEVSNPQQPNSTTNFISPEIIHGKIISPILTTSNISSTSPTDTDKIRSPSSNYQEQSTPTFSSSTSIPEPKHISTTDSQNRRSSRENIISQTPIKNTTPINIPIPATHVLPRQDISTNLPKKLSSPIVLFSEEFKNLSKSNVSQSYQPLGDQNIKSSDSVYNVDRRNDTITELPKSSDKLPNVYDSLSQSGPQKINSPLNIPFKNQNTEIPNSHTQQDLTFISAARASGGYEPRSSVENDPRFDTDTMFRQGKSKAEDQQVSVSNLKSASIHQSDLKSLPQLSEKSFSRQSPQIKHNLSPNNRNFYSELPTPSKQNLNIQPSLDIDIPVLPIPYYNFNSPNNSNTRIVKQHEDEYRDMSVPTTKILTPTLHQKFDDPPKFTNQSINKITHNLPLVNEYLIKLNRFNKLHPIEYIPTEMGNTGNYRYIPLALKEEINKMGVLVTNKHLIRLDSDIIYAINEGSLLISYISKKVIIPTGDHINIYYMANDKKYAIFD